MRPGKNRREFLGQVGNGMLIAGVGAGVATNLGCSHAFAYGPGSQALEFGDLDPLVDLMQEKKPDDLQAILIDRLMKGTLETKQLVAAAALANAETFGGQDYVGYHTEMALVPALEMSQELQGPKSYLPILKVIYRNAEQIQNVGGAKHKTLHEHDHHVSAEGDVGEKIKQATRARKMGEAESLFASIEDVPLEERFNAILPVIEDDINVHRFVLAHRSLELVDVVGEQNAQTMLRQCVRYCVDTEQHRHSKGSPPSPIRTLLPKLVEQYKLDTRKLGNRDPGDAWVDNMGDQIYSSNAQRGAELVAGALAEGVSPMAISEAISLAANALVLRQGADRWRTHGDSPGVHGSDAANAWRNIIPFANQRNAVGGLICAAYHTARYDAFKNDPYPTEAHRLKVKVKSAKELLGLAEECITSNDQAVAAAAIQVYGDMGYAVRPVFDLMLKYAISEDGRLHAEKYYRTVCEEYAAMREPFKWRQLVALARVTASAYSYNRTDQKGHRAAGYEDACSRLKVTA